MILLMNLILQDSEMQSSGFAFAWLIWFDAHWKFNLLIW